VTGETMFFGGSGNDVGNSELADQSLTIRDYGEFAVFAGQWR
jgi:hypothetical protein